MEQTPVRVNKYPNAFLFGFVSGGCLEMFIRFGTLEPMSARPFAYLRGAFTFGVCLSYYDWWRRCALEEVMIAEERQQYFKTLKAINKNVRYGEEDEIGNLTEYLAGSTTRV
jgi:hypothetical protein